MELPRSGIGTTLTRSTDVTPPSQLTSVTDASLPSRALSRAASIIEVNDEDDDDAVNGSTGSGCLRKAGEHIDIN